MMTGGEPTDPSGPVAPAVLHPRFEAKLHRVTGDELAVARPVDHREVHPDVARARVGLKNTPALLGVEELDCSATHLVEVSAVRGEVERPPTAGDLAAPPLDRAHRLAESRVRADAEVPVAAREPVEVARSPPVLRQSIDKVLHKSHVASMAYKPTDRSADMR